MSIIINIAHKIGIDKSIAYTSSSSIIAAFAGLVSIYFIGSYLTGEEQGYYFTFGSILAIQTFFDMGLTGIMTQYVAHEHAHLQWSENGISLIGDARYKSRLSYLLHFCIKWYAIISVMLLITLIIVGNIFFMKYSKTQDISWRLPWLLICIGTSLNLFLAPLMAYLQGLGKVKEVARVMFYRQLVIPIFTWGSFIIGLKLYVVGIASITTAALFILFIILSDFRPILVSILREKITEKVDYMKEIFPYQWKIALSWISGFFIFQLFNPVLFATEGAKVAGQMGMTMQVLNAISGLSMNWINTKIPLFSRLVELKDYLKLDKIFNKTVYQESSICLILLIIYYFGVALLRHFNIRFSGQLIGERFLDYLPMLLMSIPIYTNQFVFSVATYLRCHKKEPFLVNSIVMGILIMISTLLLGDNYGLYGICLGYSFLTVIIGLPWGIYIFKTKRKEWHGK